MFLEKRGDYINSLVNIKIFHENNEELIQKKIPVIYEKSKYFKITDENNNTFIDFVNNIFIRENSEYTLTVNFNTKMINLNIVEHDLSFEECDEECYLTEANSIELSYCIDNRIKIIYEFIKE